MLIGLTHHLQLDSRDEDEAEFDRPETFAFLVDQLRALGHEVEAIEVGGPIEATIARLRSLAPDLVFNTAEGRRGRVREGLWPAIFEELGLAYTGSDAFTCVLTLDKRLSKRLVAAEGVPTPQAQLVERLADLDLDRVVFPAIVKPNFEGSSKGIASDSIVTSRARLEAKVATMLGRYPEGVLVERFITGRDLTVPWIAGLSRETGGVLPIAEYRFDAPTIAGEPVIYDYNLKQVASDSVHVRVPAQIEPEQAAALVRHTQTVIKTLGLRDFARCDFRIDEAGELHFLEVNALPSFEPGSSLWEAAAAWASPRWGGKSAGSDDQRGMAGEPDTSHAPDVLAAIVASASVRFGLPQASKRKRRREQLRVGLIHNLKRDPTAEDQAEFDSIATVEAIGAALRELGHEPVLLEATRELPSMLP